ncbi:PEP-CTERM sorting domain-containing protein [Duganella ginsengisoli]|uniref:PEP-CTERM sorting domain-containing protein n=2 Tax=Pseudoduganella ginsengisoli TaxID=1462440 RepID=A0A6L6Q230_9BURK|nr:PEP-CTERM sorting domain-containing protein [Pseudoduganella ginsengisoli]
MGNNNPASVTVDNNLGYLNDGLLNGEGNLIPFNYFITQSQLQDLNPNDVGARDPGWVELGRITNASALNSAGSATMVADSIKTSTGTLNLGSILSFTESAAPITSGGSRAGTWTLSLDANIVNVLKNNGLFQRNNFDQLAFVVKASDKWAVYDFDFTKLPAGMFDLTQPYSLSGTWNLNDFKNDPTKPDQGLSFLGVWARDPVLSQPTNVPEPGVLALFGAGLLGMAAARRRRQSK